ncbi:aromatic ring-hydroxylating dioxygenase subunit alpha [Niveispirillum sp. BGYR6]|uniref:aromatic ring-hydroxylating oxygenase subunit alpha n=1 Tax=Niveispirillum sp. BGYR6 TaxID=2971249 RepID=UPI0022B9C5EE|nr:aromatic ring-hydroxylating dioxygenase subunit alpha [Niveispirillum sp. BGYR6]MDG5496166.1 aromatic ring-hydroxylating dioxygenase subunit alpha [Niveispirillum sp. BGYR6]
MDTDTRPVPDFLRQENYHYMGSEPLKAERYTSPEFFRRELDKMWPRVWQFAAREEDLPEPGDFALYENAGRSYLVTRQPDGSVRAFHNVCLHRGRKLRLESGSAAEFKCPFHGFSWNTNGSLKNIPCRWDFPHLKEEKMALPEAQVGRWAGYIFIREAAEGPSLEEYLAPLPDFFQRWRHEECTTVIWVGKVVNANWKAVAEAFMEAWHTIETHPQILPFTGDANTQYSTYGDHVNAALTPFAVMSPHIDPTGKPQQWIVDEFLKYNGRAGGTDMSVQVPDGMSARRAMAAANREKYQADSGYDHSHVTDAELLDAFVYNVFPNFAPWGGFMPNIVYRWRPWPDQDKTLMEVRILVRLPADAPKPPPVEMNFLGPDQPWTDAKELGVLGDVFQQDMENLPFVQDGLKCSKNGEVQLGNYQEIRVRHLHATLDKYLAD